MKLIIATILLLTACSTAYGEANTEVNGDLEDECFVSIIQLEEAFIKDSAIKPLDPTEGIHIARMQMLIDMLSLCTENYLLPGSETMLDKLQKRLSDLNIGEMVK